MDQPLEVLAAEYAPLPRPMIKKLLTHITLSPKLNWEVNLHRSNIFDRFNPAVILDHQQDQRKVTIDWTLQQLSAVLGKNFPRSTLFTWKKRGFIEFSGRGEPLPEDVARVLLYYSLLQAIPIPEREILPSLLEERNSWCWTQQIPASPATPFMLPRYCYQCDESAFVSSPHNDAQDLSLFWTPWPGAAWDKNHGWLQIGGIGAITCGYLLTHRAEPLDYNFLTQFLKIWFPNAIQEIPYFRDVSLHGHKFQRYQLPSLIMQVMLVRAAESRLTGLTFNP